MASTPATTFNLPAQDFINETFDFSVTFDNTGTSAGYGPFFDLVVPQGITLGSASYLDASVPLVAYTRTATGWVDENGAAVIAHPYGSFALPTGTTGEKWYLVELPFGSFVGDQPPAEIVFANNILSKANGAQVGTALSLSSRGGFRYGNDALNNGEIVQQGGTTTQSITPKVIELTKTADAPEAETATGENFARTYTLTVNIANGEKVDNLQVKDFLPNNLVYVPGTLSISGATATSIEQPTAGSPQNSPNNDFVINLGSVTGTTSESDVVITYKAYAPKLDANNASVIDAASGNDRTALNESQVTGTYNGIAVSKGTTDVTGTADDPADYELQLKSLAIQKDVAVVGGGTAQSGSVLEYTLTFQISDYFSFKDIAINDIFSDGQRFDSSFAPRLTINGNNGTTGTTTFGNFSGSVNGTFTSDNLTGTVATGTNGATTLNFNVSQRLIDSAVDADGILVGDLVDSVKQSGTTATLVYRTVIQDEFTKLHTTAGYTGDASVDVADLLTNDVTLSGKVVGSDQLEEDTSSAEIQIPEPTASKSIYAIDGNTSFTDRRIAPGQTITYRLTVNAPIADIEQLKLTDYLPLPIFEAGELTGNIGAFSGVPTAGTITLGPSHTLNTIVPGVTPTFTTDNTKNTIAIDFGSFDDPQNRSVTIDVLFTVTATDEAFSDGLKLTNQALVDYGSTDNTFVAAVTEIVQVELLQPELNITKGVVSTTATSKTFDKTVGPVTFATAGTTGAAFTGAITSAGLAANPVDANLSGVDAGDLVRFALVIENTGGNGAFDAAIKDVLPTGLSNPQNLRVTDGAGNVLTYTGDLFTTGLVLDDDADGALDKGRTGTTATTNGKNIIVITYDATVNSTVNPLQTLTSGAQILQFAGTEGGTNHTANATNEDWEDDASTTAATPKLTLNLVGTEINGTNNSNTQAVIGELVEYELVLTVPEGTTPSSTLTNTLPFGLSFAQFTSLTFSNGVTSSQVTDVAGLNSNTSATSNGRNFTLDLGTLTNSNTDNGTAETITLRFQAVVSNISNNQGNTNLNHSASNVKFNWNNGTARSVTATEADNVSNRITLVEPDVSITKDVVVNGSGNKGDAGDPLEYTITISHAATSPDAFDITFQDPLSSKIIDEAITTVTDSAGILTANDFEIVNGTLQLKSGVNVDLVGSRTITIKVLGNLSSGVVPNETIDSNATVTWSSLDGTVTNRSILASATNDEERTGTGSTNDYTKSDGAPITVENVEPIKSIVSTSETATNNPTLDAGNRIVNDEVAIGEIIRYRLVTRLSEGQIDNLQIRDNLPAGLQFIEGTAKAGLVNTDTNNLSTTDAGLTAAIVDNTDPDTFTPTFVLPDANVSASATTDSDTYASGTDIFFKFGNLTNTGTNSGSEYVVIEFDALVVDEGGNQAATALVNDFEVGIGGTTVNTSSDATVTVVAPELSITQTLEVNGGTSGDAGDIVTITLTVANIGDADAYEVKLEDVLDATKFDLANATSVSLPAGFTFDKSIPGKIAYRGDTIAKGTTETFTFTVPLKTAANAGETLVSQAKITEATTIEGTPISGVERDIANPDILAQDKQLTIDRPTATKSLTTTSINNDPSQTVTVGEILTYTVTAIVPEGTTADLKLLDTLDPGLAFVDVVSIVPSSGNVTTSAGSFAAGMGTISNASSADIDQGRVLTVNLGNVTNSNTDNNTPESIAITYRAVVLNAGVVNDGTPHDNTAVVSWTAGGTSQNVTVNAGDVTVSEPKLALEVQVLDDNGNPAENVQGNIGDIVTVRVTVSSNGSDAFEANAFDLAFSNNLPAGMTFVPGSITPVSGVTPTSSGFSGGKVNVAYNSFADGSTSVFTFQVTLDGTVTTGDITNSGELTYTSIAGTAGTLSPYNPLAGERTGDTSNTGGTANDLRETNTASVTLNLNLNQPPETNTAIDNVAPENTIQVSGLGGNDPNGGTVANYKIDELPGVGTLYLGNPNNGGTLVKAGDIIPAAQIDNLFYTAPVGFSGTTFKYSAIDNNDAKDPTPATVTLNPTTPTNLPPQTNNTSQTIVPGDTNSLTGLGGSDPDGTVALYQIISLPGGGTLYIGDREVTEDTILTPTQLQNLVFDAQPGFAGTTFIYAAIDNKGAKDATPATVTLTAGNAPPETQEAVVSVSPNSSVSLASQLVATDPDGSVSTYTIRTLPGSGQLLFNGNPVNEGDTLTPAQLANLTFTAGSNFTNTSFTYTATDDDGDSDRTPAIVFLKTPGSNLPPIAPDASISISPGTTIDLPNLPATDPDGTITTYTIDSLPTGGKLYLGNPTSGGLLVTQGQELTENQFKQLFFQADGNFNGSSFTYTATDDGGGIDAGTVTLTVGNRSPQTQSMATTFKPGETRLLTGLGGSDPDGSIAYYTITSIPFGGILYLGNPSDNIQVKSGDILTPDQISQLTFRSGSNFTGTSFTYTTTDNSGLTDPTPATVTIGTATTPTPTPEPEPTPEPNPTPTPEPEPTPTPNPEPQTPEPQTPESCQDCCPTPPTLNGLEIAPPQPILGTDVAPPREPDTSRFSRTHSSDDDDAIRGNDDKDDIWGDRGHDTITGNEGDDRLAGDSRDLDDAERSGEDRLYGGGGNDELNGNEKSDTVSGGNGNDIAYGGKDGDLVSGDLGNDTLGGDLGDDTLLGSLGRFAGVGSSEERDELYGNRGRDLLKGGEGEDSIYAGKEEDFAYGGKDNDEIYGELGHDTLTGDEGNDVVRGGTEDTTNPDTEGRDSIDGANGNDILFGNEKEDILRGGNGGDRLHGGKDGDFMSGDLGNDTLYGERGNDTLLGSLGRFAGVGSQEERDLLSGNDGNDILKGGEGEDSIYAGKDNDLVYAGKDNDMVFGDWGSDTLAGDQGNDTISGGNGKPDDPEDATGRDLIFGGDGDDLMDGNLGNDSLVSGSGNDIAMGGRGDDIAWGEAGNDLLFGDLGNDTLCGNDGDDTLVGSNGNPGNTGDGDDRLNGGNGNDNLYGNEGSDTLFGGDGEDTLLGGKQNDILKGGEGNDFLAGEQGNDRLIGGGGSDVFEITTGGVDTIADFQVGVDRLVFSGGFTAEQLTLTQVNNSTAINLGTEQLAILEGVKIDRLSEVI